MLKPTVGIELLGVENQTGVPGAMNGDLLYGKLSALARIASHQHPSAHLTFDPYRKNSQKRCFASILQTNHGYIHLRGPNGSKLSTTSSKHRALAGLRITWHSQDGAHFTADCGEVELDG